VSDIVVAFRSCGPHARCTKGAQSSHGTLGAHGASGVHDVHGAYRAAVFDITGRKTSATLSVLFRFAHKNAGQEGSKFYSDLRNASSLAPTKYYCINCHCSAVTMPIKLSSYMTWRTSETVASLQLPLNPVFFCLAEVVSHVIL